MYPLPNFCRRDCATCLSMWRKFGSAMATLQRWSWTSSLLSPSEDINCAFSASCSSRALPLLVARFLVNLAKLFRAGITNVAKVYIGADNGANACAWHLFPSADGTRKFRAPLLLSLGIFLRIAVQKLLNFFAAPIRACEA